MNRFQLPVMATVALWIPCAFSVLPAQAGDYEQKAREILDATNIKGGLIVHIGCGEGKLTGALGAGENYLVHGLDTSAKNVEKAREHLRSVGLYGSVSVDRFDGERLPYADNLVNLVVAERAGEAPMAEIMRVLVPNGLAYVKSNGRWTKTQKPWPGEIDEWTHWLHSPSGNAVSEDLLVAPPRHLQWVAKPLWMKHHNVTPSFSAMVTAKGKIFYILDEALPGIMGMPDKWHLFARDAFNGTLLWKLPIEEWGWSAWGPPASRTGSRFDQPVDIQRRLVAVDDCLYAALGFSAPLSKIDAQTGQVIHTYAGSEGVSEVLYHRGTLIVSVHRKPKGETSNATFGKSILLYDAATGELLWEKDGLSGIVTKSMELERFTTLFMVAGEDGIFFADRESIVCIDLKDGNERWRQSRPAQEQIVSSYFKSYIGNLSTLIAHKDVLLFSQIVAKKEYRKVLPWYNPLESQLMAYSAKTGKKLWVYDCGTWDYDAPNSVFVIDDLAWTMTRDDYGVVGLNPRTGKVEKQFSAEHAMKDEHHHRCYGNKATANYILTARRGSEFLDIHTGENTLNHWTRGACRYGILPANGLLYAPPNPCICFQTAKVNGFLALSGDRKKNFSKQIPDRLEKGPAYGKLKTKNSKLKTENDWPTYRHDSNRSGMIASDVPAKLRTSWETNIGGKLSSVTISEGRVFVVSVDSHTLHALNQQTGEESWSYTASARTDTPPTVHKGIVLLGCADGYVHALRASDGELAWRFRAAPYNQRIIANGQLESPWPVHGSVLVEDGVAFVTAGRSSFLDGGIYVCALDPATGEVLQERTIYSIDSETGKAHYSNKLRYDMPPDYPGALSDILVSEGSHIYMRHTKLDPKNISRNLEKEISEEDKKVFYAGRTQVGKVYSPGPQVASSAGLLDDSWFNQSYWSYAGKSHCRLLVRDERFTYGVSAYQGKPSRHSRSKFDVTRGKYRLFADDRDDAGKRVWIREVPIRVMAMVAATDHLFAAGTPHVIDPHDPWASYDGRKGGSLRVVSKNTGQTLADHELDSPPVWDGMAAAGGCLYLSTKDGTVLCLAGR